MCEHCERIAAAGKQAGINIEIISIHAPRPAGTSTDSALVKLGQAVDAYEQVMIGQIGHGTRQSTGLDGFLAVAEAVEGVTSAQLDLVVAVLDEQPARGMRACAEAAAEGARRSTKRDPRHDRLWNDALVEYRRSWLAADIQARDAAAGRTTQNGEWVNPVPLARRLHLAEVTLLNAYSTAYPRAEGAATLLGAVLPLLARGPVLSVQQLVRPPTKAHT